MALFPREIWKKGGREERWRAGKTWNSPTKMMSLRTMMLVLSSCR